MDALNSSGGSWEVQTTTVSGITFIKRDGWVFVSGNPSGSSSGFLSSAFRPPATVGVPYSTGSSEGVFIRPNGEVQVMVGNGTIIQPTVYPARQA